jgi:hypothetical protein
VVVRAIVNWWLAMIRVLPNDIAST